ncbi:MAG: ATP phosphoribosyltransferase regulatory subunit, partial [Gammaproteobacteria bacterium]|nr:ATP phosphoribosyltransferase regulatory subunit [Gammaproteobacteria bacterium]
MSITENWLLPEGVDEVLPPEAARLEELRQEILALCWRWGYELVIPPLIEYLDSLLSGMGEDLDLQTFKLTDQLTGRTMGVRADITPQVARIDARRLRREGVSRLCYLGPVLHTLPDRFSGSRNPLQLGAELFGCEDPAADVEIIMLMLDAIRLAGIEDIWLDLGHVGVFRSLADHLALDNAAEAAVFAALQRKALPELERLLDTAGVDAAARAWLVAVCEINGGLDAL